MTPPPSRAKWLLLVGVLLSGVGLVLFVLGFDGHTTEALPFGVVLTLAGLAVCGPSVRAFRSAFQQIPIGGDAAASLGDADGTPLTVACANCGAHVPLRLESPSEGLCLHCDERFSFEPGLAERLGSAATLLKKEDLALRHIEDAARRVAKGKRTWMARLWAITLGLLGLSAASVLFAWHTRMDNSSWHGFFMFGLSAGLVALIATVTVWRLVPAVVDRIAGRWAARQIPGVAGLACRVCAAELPDAAQPVLRCGYCDADNLASPDVIERVSTRVEHVLRSRPAITQRAQRAEELVLFSLVAFPLLVLMVWFAIGAATGGVLLRSVGAYSLAPDPEARYRVIRVHVGEERLACLASVRLHGERADVEVSAAERWSLPSQQLEAITLEGPLSPAQLLGRRLRKRGAVVEVYRNVRSPGRHQARTDGGGPVYLSGRGAGQLVCLETPPPPGPSSSVDVPYDFWR